MDSYAECVFEFGYKYEPVSIYFQQKIKTLAQVLANKSQSTKKVMNQAIKSGM